MAPRGIYPSPILPNPLLLNQVDLLLRQPVEVVDEAVNLAVCNDLWRGLAHRR